jgi:tRNA-dihydrouridine synthase
MDQRYRSAADWDLIAAAAETVDIPIVGNGDVLSYVDANVRLRDYG